MPSPSALLTGLRASAQRRKWITRQLNQLDPEVDFVQIMRLSTLYGMNDLQLHWFYAVGTPAAGIAPAVVDAVWREGRGTYNVQPSKRRDDSVDHLMLWFEHGPDDAATKQSVDMINRYHAHFAKDYPEGFANPEDYIYVLCLNATEVFTALRLLGLPGMTDKQQRAAYLFWSKLAQHFTGPGGRPVTELAAFPATFADMVTYVEDYQSRPWPVHRPGHLATTSAIEHFTTTWFPKPLHFFGRAMVTAFMSPHVMRAHAIPQAPAAVAWAARTAMKTMILVSTHVIPDAAEGLPDQRRRRAAAGKGNKSGVDVAVHRAIDGTARKQGGIKPTGCPHLAPGA